MTEANLFLPVDTVPLYSDSIGHVTLYDASHANESEEQRIYTVTTIASLAYGNESAKNPEALYERMKSIKHESLWEFIRYGYIDGLDLSNGIDGSLRMEKFPTIAEIKKVDDSMYDTISAHKQNIACFRIKVPIFVTRQFMRHRSFSYLEMSRRYTKDSKVPFEFWLPEGTLNTYGISYKEYSDKKQQDYLEDCKMFHTQVASRFLPQTTYTEFYIMGEVEGLRNFFRLRLDEHAQAEIREVAEAMLQLLSQYQPELYKKVSNE